ncbi:MAG: saccharopine dehydrogenase, partial [Candidatus Aminicenantes bacterium]
MKKVLVLGAGLVAKPLVNYLLDQPDFSVTVADVEAGRAAKLVAGHPRGASEVLDI